ncbi:MAG: sugar ABC transporter permease, partial [Salinigranum sp.]
MSSEQATREERTAVGTKDGLYAGAVRWIETLDDTQFAYLLLSPALLLLGVIALWPLLSTLQMSFHADSIRGASQLGPFVGLDHYVGILTGTYNTVVLSQPFFDLSQPFKSALIVTFVFTVVSVFFETLIGFGQALVLDQDFRGRRW